MKQLLKTSLKRIGLLKYYQRQRKQANREKNKKRFKDVNRHEVIINGNPVLFNTEDDYSKNWFFPRYHGGKLHEPAVSKVFVEYVKDSDCVIDAGAHLGYFTCLAAGLSPNGSVHSFEVDPKCIPIIQKNISANQFNQVRINNLAIANDRMEIHIPVMGTPNPRLSIGTKKEAEPETMISVMATSIDQYVQEHQLEPDFIKIDVEGAELDALKGMEQTLQRPNLKMLVEVHPKNLEAFGYHYQEVLQILSDSGFHLYELIEHRSDELNMRPIDAHADLAGNTMVFCERG